MHDLQNMKTGILLEHYKGLVLQMGRNLERSVPESEQRRISQQADLAEEQILRRMAW